MKEVRYFYVPDCVNQVELPEQEATHAIRALRMKEGDELFLIDGCGTFYHAIVTVVTNKRCMYKIIQSMPQDPTWNGHLHLAMAPTKMMDRVEWMAEKCTEIGFNELSFLDCQFSERQNIRTDRVDKIVVSAVKQSRKAWKPVVNDLTSFRSFIQQERNGLKFICHCYDEFERQDLFELLSESGRDDSMKSQDVTVLIGPEGDFSVEEVQYALEHGYQSVSLGKSRLRTETACLFAVSMMNLCRRK